MQNIKTFEDACTLLNIGNELPDVSRLPVKNQVALIAHYKLIVIAEALNEGWTPDWSNDDEYKYYPWWDMENGFVLYYVNFNCTNTFVGSRLCFKNREIAKYIATEFESLYKDYMLVS